MKKLVLLMGVLLLCGCKAEYNVKIDSTVEETTIIYQNATQDFLKEDILNNYREYLPLSSSVTYDDDDTSKLDGVNYYDRTYKDYDTGYKITYKGSFSGNSVQNSTISNKAFKNVSYTATSSKLLISTSEGIQLFTEYDIESITINIETDYEITNNNATSVDGNIYTWVFTKEDNAKSIYLEGKKENKESNNSESNNNSNKESNQESNQESNNEDSEENEEQQSSIKMILLCLAGFAVIIVILFTINMHKM